MMTQGKIAIFSSWKSRSCQIKILKGKTIYAYFIYIYIRQWVFCTLNAVWVRYALLTESISFLFA